MKVLIPLEGSATSNAQLDFIASRAARTGARPELRLLNVQFPIPPGAARAAGRELVRSYHQTEAKPVLDPSQKCRAAAGLKAKAQCVVGSPAQVVSRTATQGHADLVVMGSRGQTAPKGLLFRSAGQARLASSTTPLLVLREGSPPRAASLRLVIAVDGSRHGLAALQPALALQAVFGPAPQIRLLHVVDGCPGRLQSLASVHPRGLGPAALHGREADTAARAARRSPRKVGAHHCAGCQGTAFCVLTGVIWRFEVQRPNQLWGADFTSVSTWQGLNICAKPAPNPWSPPQKARPERRPNSDSGLGRACAHGGAEHLAWGTGERAGGTQAASCV